MGSRVFSAIAVFSLMVPIMVLSSMLVRSWLNTKKTWIIIFVVFLILAVSGNLFSLYMENYADLLAVKMLSLPFYTICIYKILYVCFLKVFKREPIDTFFNFKDDIFWDSLFNAALIIATVFLPMILIAFFVMKSNDFKIYSQKNSAETSKIEVMGNHNMKNLTVPTINNSNWDELSSDSDKLVLPKLKKSD